MPKIDLSKKQIKESRYNFNTSALIVRKGKYKDLDSLKQAFKEAIDKDLPRLVGGYGAPYGYELKKVEYISNGYTYVTAIVTSEETEQTFRYRLEMDKLIIERAEKAKQKAQENKRKRAILSIRKAVKDHEGILNEALEPEVQGIVPAN